MQNFNYFDVIVTALTILLGLKGLFRGFIKEFFALIGIVGGVFVASRLAFQVGTIIDSAIPMNNNSTIMLIGFVATLISFWIIAYFIGMVLSKVLSLSGLGIFDRLLGFIFGAGKIFLLLSIIIYAISQVDTINKGLQDKVKDSIMFPILQNTGNYIIKIDTQKFQKKVTNSIDKVVDTTQKTIEHISTDAVKEKIQQIKGAINDK